jgi:hypothetical protein
MKAPEVPSAAPYTLTAAGSAAAAAALLLFYPPSWPAQTVVLALAAFYAYATVGSLAVGWWMTYGKQLAPALTWRRHAGWHARLGGQDVWGYRTPWGALWGAWCLHTHHTGRRYLSERGPAMTAAERRERFRVAFLVFDVTAVLAILDIILWPPSWPQWAGITLAAIYAATAAAGLVLPWLLPRLERRRPRGPAALVRDSENTGEDR